MGWIGVALASAAVSGVLSIVDKQTISRYTPSFRSFALVLVIAQTLWCIATLIAVPISPDVGPWDIAMTLLSGILWGAGLMVYMSVLRTEEVSRASPVFHTYPALVAVLGVTLLGENLSGLQWMAVLVTMAGAVLITSRDGPGRILGLGRPFYLLILASGLASVGQVTNKYILEDVPFWNVFALRNLGVALPFALLLSRNSVRELKSALQHPVGRLYIVGGEFFFSAFAVWLALAAVNSGPVSIVSALMGTRPVFVFVYSTLLSSSLWHVMDEPLSRDTMIVKAIAIAMVVAGVGAITIL